MVEINRDHITFNYDLCRQCGACVAVCPTGALKPQMRPDGTHDILVDNEKCVMCGNCCRVCPAHASEPNNYETTIRSFSFFLASNSSPAISEKASSGGVARTLIIESLRSGAVDGVYALGPDESFPFAKGEFYTSDYVPGYDELPNSVYHTVMQCSEIKKVKKCKRLMIVGTSCQLWALSRALKNKADEIIKVCIFCKQQKTLASTRFIAKMAGAKIDSNDSLKVTYRGNGWPGNVEINGCKLPYSRAAQLPFGRKLWTVSGCNACSDPFGVSAESDVALMDPWEIDSDGRSVTLCSALTDVGRKLIENTPELKASAAAFEEILPALDLSDIFRKRQLARWYNDEKVTTLTNLAGHLDKCQRKVLQSFLTASPRLPMIFYRALCKLPDWRKLLIRYKCSQR